MNTLYKIVDVGKRDGYFLNRKELIGRLGWISPERDILRGDAGYFALSFKFNDDPGILSGNTIYFLSVKIEPVRTDQLLEVRW